MSVPDPVVQTSFSESELKEENELRINDIELPLDDTSSAYIQPPGDEISEKILEISSDTRYSNEFETCEDNDLLSRQQTEIRENLNLNSDSQNDAITSINSFNSPFSQTLQTFSILSNEESEGLFPHSFSDKFENESPSIADKSSPLISSHTQDSSPYGSSSSSFNLICNKSPASGISQTFDIPLPEQNWDYTSSPKLNCSKKFPNSDSSMKNQSFDLSLNLKSPKSDMDVNSCETNTEHIDNSVDNKSLPHVIDVSDMYLDLDSTEKKKSDSSRYSPSRLDSDEENQEFSTAKPKVLGKEQAKKRLMAFSLSRQSNTPVLKKHNKLLVSQKAAKEKPPNPNKSFGVQEQFRATISAIEEEKKKMMQNMPNYLLMYTNSLAKVGDGPVMNPAEKFIKDGGDIDINTLTKIIMEKEDKDQGKSKCGHSSPNRSRSSVPSSSSKKRQTKESDEKNDDTLLKKVESINNWKSFVESGFALDSDFRRLKLRVEEMQKQKDRSKRFWSRGYKTLSDYKPIFNYLTNSAGMAGMAPLKAKTQKPGHNASFKEKTVKYTLTKPVITWAENPAHATDFYMPKQMLLENCDKITSSILYDVMDQRSEMYKEVRKPRQKYWYPQFAYLTESSEVEDTDNTDKIFEILQTKERNTKERDQDDDNGIGRKESSKSEWKQKISAGTKTLNWELEHCDLLYEKHEVESYSDDPQPLKSKEKRVNVVNKSYPSDEENKRNPVKELFVGDVKVQLDLGLNSVKVKSKWDSDYDEDEKDSWNGIEKLEGKRTHLETRPMSGEHNKKSESLNAENFCKSSDPDDEFISNQTNTSLNDLQNTDFSLDGPKEKLASEYEKFMKLVSCDIDNEADMNSIESSFEKIKKKSSNSAIRLIMADNKSNKNIDPTDWDLESDREDKLLSKKIESMKEDTTDSFSLLLSGYDSKNREKGKSPSRKKSGKLKSKDKSKKLGKNKKKKYKGRSSTESSSDSSDSGSDSDSSDSDDQRRKKKKKRVTKYKKRYSSSSTSSSTSSTSSSSSSSSSSDSGSDSDSKSSKSKKNRRKKKKNKVEKSVSGGSSGSNDETGKSMLKHLDLKKQQIIKKIEEIDSLDITTNKNSKTEKEEKDKKSDSEISLKPGKRKDDVKSVDYFDKSRGDAKESEETNKKTEKFDTSHSGGEIDKEGKKKSKTKKWSSESSSDGEEKENQRTKTAKNLKEYSRKKVKYSSSESDSGSYSRKSKKRSKRKKKKENGQKSFTKNTQEMPNWNDHLLSDGPDFKNDSLEVGESLSWLNTKKDWGSRRRNTGDDPHRDGEGLKDLGDWENSSVEESPEERRSRESTWDEELPVSGVSKLSNEDTKKENREVNIIGEQLIHGDRNKFLNEFNLESKGDLLFIESSFSLDHKASRDSYSRENSSSMQLFPSATGTNCNLSIDYQMEETLHGVGDEFRKEKSKPSKDELYSPGHTDSDLTDENEKTECRRENESRTVYIKQELLDHVNSGNEVTDERGDKTGVNAMSLPSVTNIMLPGEIKKELKDEKLVSDISMESGLPRSDFIAIPLAKENESHENIRNSSERSIKLDFRNKKRMISVKLQQKFQPKVASVFQSDSEEELDGLKKGNTTNGENETASKGRSRRVEVNIKKEISKAGKKTTEEHVCYDSSRGRGKDRVHKSRWSTDNYKENAEKYGSPRWRSPSPDSKYFNLKGEKLNPDRSDIRREKDTERSPRLKTESSSESGSKKSDEVTEKEDGVRPIPVLTGFDIRMSNGLPWNRSHMLGSEDIGFSCDHLDLMNPDLDSYKLYGSSDGGEAFMHNIGDRGYFGGKYEHNYDIQGTERDVLLENRIRMDKRKSRSKSGSPRKRRRSKTPDRRRSPRNRSPKHRSTSPRRRGRSPFSPRRRGSPRSRRYKASRSPERKKSRSPRKRRHSPSRRSRSISPRKHKDRMDSPRRRSMSPGKDGYRDFGVRNLIHLTGMPDDENRELCPSGKFDSPMGFTRSLADSTISDSELNNAFYSHEFPGEYGSQNYPEEVTVNNLITLQNHDADKQTNSPKRLPLDQRLEIELGCPSIEGDQYQMSYQQFPDNQYSNSYPCDDGNSQNFYSTQNSDFNGQYFNGQPPPSNFDQYQQYPCHNHPPQNSVLQVGNIMEVVPTSTMMPHSKGHQIMQVGNVLQVVPSPKSTQTSQFGYSGSMSPGKSQNGDPNLPVNNMPNPEAIINPLIKAIQLEREKRKKEKEKRRLEREARRKARQQKREAKIMSVNEKLKKSVQDEGLMLGQEVEEDELLEEVEHPSPPVPVEIITDSSQSSLPPAGKGILITAGFIPRPASEKKEVRFADGICPGEGTSTSGGEDRASPPPKPKLPKEKRYRKKKTKLKKKVKVHIIRQVIQDDEDEDDLSPPPPPPGDPPPVFYAKFPFGIKAQYPVYHTQTTTTTFTTVQFPSETFQ